MKRSIVWAVMAVGMIAVASVLWGTWGGMAATLPSLMIVVGGCIAACAAAFPIARLTGLHRAVAGSLDGEANSPERLVDELVGCAQAARTEGLLTASTVGDQGRHPLLAAGLLLLVQDADEEMIRSTLRAQSEGMSQRSAQARQVLEAIGRYAPAFGVLGTIGATIIMLRNLGDPATIGPAAGAALASMLYGSLIATVVAAPLTDRLSSRAAEEELASMIITAGICRIRAGDRPEEVRERLLAYLPGRGAGAAVRAERRKAA